MIPDYFCNYSTKQKDHSAKANMLKDGNNRCGFPAIWPPLDLAQYLDIYCLKENEIR